MASWLMRMVASSAKSTGRRRALCSGLQAFAHRRSFRGPCRRLFQDTTGPGTGAPLGATTTPANRPGENKRTRPERSERRFRMFIATPVKVLRRPLESALVTAITIRDDEGENL